MNHSKITFEILWLAITLIVIVIFMLPIYNAVGMSYPFYLENGLIIFIAITFMRYLFFLKHHWIAVSNWIKVVFIFVPIPVFIYLMDSLYDFQALYDEEGIGSIMTDIPFKSQKNMSMYIRAQMIFFWVAAFVSNILMPFRMLVSIWKRVNKGMD